MYTLEYYEYDWQQNLIAQGTLNTESKQEAWYFFGQGIQEHFIHDFWEDFAWDDNFVETIHSAEDGYNCLALRKWDGFDDDISIAWKYNDKRYKTLEELWEAEPKFRDHTMEIDKPVIRCNTDNTVAVLDIDIHFRDE